MTVKIWAISALLFSGLAASAEEANRAEDAASVPKRSSFVAGNIPRDPFQRIEARNLPEQTPEVTAAAGEDLAAVFHVTSVSIDRLAIAIINRKAFAENDRFRLRHKDKLLDVRVLQVRDDAVKLDCAGTTMTIPVARKTPGVE